MVIITLKQHGFSVLGLHGTLTRTCVEFYNDKQFHEILRVLF